MNRDWKDYITTVALTSLETAKYNKVNLLPHTEDLVKLDTFLRSEIAECLEQYDDEDTRPTLDDGWFRRICRATCARNGISRVTSTACATIVVVAEALFSTRTCLWSYTANSLKTKSS